MADVVVAPKVTDVNVAKVELVPYSKKTLEPEEPFGSTVAFKVVVVLAIELAGKVTTSTGSVGVVTVTVTDEARQVPLALTFE